MADGRAERRRFLVASSARPELPQLNWSASGLLGDAVRRVQREAARLHDACGNSIEANLLAPVARFLAAVYQFLERVAVTIWGALAHTPASPDMRVDPRELADPDSRFVDVEGLSVHYKEAGPSSAPVSALLLHGFGASQFSWHRVLQPIADAFGGRAVAFDRPAFGLTSRPLPDGRGEAQCGKASGHSCARGCEPGYCKLYGYPFAGELAIALLDKLNASTDPVVVVGHSAGGLLAAQIAMRYPDRVKALVLVAPAIFTGIGGPTVPAAVPAQEGLPSPLEPYPTPPLFSLAYATAAVTRARVAAGELWAKIRVWLRAAAKCLAALWRAAVLRFVRSRLFVWFIRGVTLKRGPQGVAAAFHDPSKCTPETIAGYTKPFKAWDWDTALAEFVAATLGGGFWGARPDAPPVSVWNRLAKIQVPTCLITGDKDTFVPPQSTARVASGIANAELHTVPACGHLPHEELPEETMAIISAFAEKVKNGGPWGSGMQG